MIDGSHSHIISCFIADLWYNFDSYKEDEEGGINHLGTGYDYLSIMHYDRRAFAIDDEKPTITRVDPAYDYIIGTAGEPSSTDLYRIRALYSL